MQICYIATVFLSCEYLHPQSTTASLRLQLPCSLDAFRPRNSSTWKLCCSTCSNPHEFRDCASCASSSADPELPTRFLQSKMPWMPRLQSSLGCLGPQVVCFPLFWTYASHASPPQAFPEVLCFVESRWPPSSCWSRASARSLGP